MRHTLCGRLCAAAAVLVLGSVASAAITIETVPVGNPGNTADTTGYGSVNYAYNIGKYEVTAGQYTAFLNAVAATDTYDLYNMTMSNTSWGSGIARSGDGTVGNPYTYTVDADFVNRPVNYVSFWDATRFANWLHNGQPTGAQDNSTTEDGAYTLTSDGINGNTITRNTGWQWAVTSEDEWYKAAYYNPDASSYYLYPTSSNSAPGRDMNDVSENNANYYPYPIDSEKYTTVVGEFQYSDSPYGTFDQGGNVWEWNEAFVDSTYRGFRGGALDDSVIRLQSGTRPSYGNPIIEHFSIGFRVSQVPEPASMAILALGSIGMLMRRRGAGR